MNVLSVKKNENLHKFFKKKRKKKVSNSSAISWQEQATF
jgi:hypothetical protein